MDTEIEQIMVKPDVSKFEIDETPRFNVDVKVEIDPVQLPNTETAISDKVYENGRINRVKCTICDNTFKNRANMKQHVKYVHATEEDVEECTQCFRTFKSLAHLRSHMSTIHAKETNIQCKHCDKTFLTKKKLNNHILYTHPNPGESVSCQTCFKSFKSKLNLKTHIRNVHKTESAKCDQCNKSFKNHMLLQRHIKWSHPVDGMAYRCQECGRVLPSIACYKKHMKNVHSDSETQCFDCLKIFKTFKTFQRHYKVIHCNEKAATKTYKQGDIPCDECHMKFSTDTALQWHIQRNHVDKKDYICEICQKSYVNGNGLKRHIDMVHSLNPSMCNICRKVFKSPLSLQRHVHITHAPPEAAQVCDICQKTFKCSLHLRIHINTVHPNKDVHICNVCNKEFATKKYLVKHMKSHTVTKDFPCDVCGKYFKMAYDVTKHKRRVHPKLETVTKETFTCDKCGQDFDGDVAFEQHVLVCAGHLISNFVMVQFVTD